jgi:hypothetical protein
LKHNDSHSRAAKCETRNASAKTRIPATGPRDSGARHLSASSLSEAEALCLAAICRGGSAVLVTRHGVLVGLCAGAWLPASPSTFLRLLGRGLLEFAEPTRLVPAPGAAVELSRLPPRVARAAAELELA